MNGLEVRPVDNAVGKRMIIKNHYSHTIPFGVTLCLGVYQIGPPNPFISITDDILMGVIVYSVPSGANVYQSISPLIDSQDQVFELVRWWISDKLGKNTESWVIGQSFKYIKEYYPKIKAIISFADSDQNHCGTIYQSTNFIYQGLRDCSGGEQFSWDNGKTWHHFKGLANKHGITSRKELMKILPDNTIFKEGSMKHRYLIIMGNKKQKREIFKTLKYKPMEYPKAEQKEKQI